PFPFLTFPPDLRTYASPPDRSLVPLMLHSPRAARSPRGARPRHTKPWRAFPDHEQPARRPGARLACRREDPSAVQHNARSALPEQGLQFPQPGAGLTQPNHHALPGGARAGQDLPRSTARWDLPARWAERRLLPQRPPQDLAGEPVALRSALLLPFHRQTARLQRSCRHGHRRSTLGVRRTRANEPYTFRTVPAPAEHRVFLHRGVPLGRRSRSEGTGGR